MANRTRPLILRVPVNEQERELIEQKMKLIPTKNFAAYARKMLIDGYIIQIDHSDIKAMTAEIQKIGVNVNQEDIDEIKGVLNEIWRLQRLSLLKAL